MLRFIYKKLFKMIPNANQSENEQEIKSIFSKKPDKPDLTDLTKEEKKDFIVEDVVETNSNITENIIEEEEKEVELLSQEPVVYQVEFFNKDKQEEVMFSNFTPIIKNNVLTLLKPFSKIELKETVLKRKTITIACKTKQLADEFSVSLNNGVFFKCISSKEPWLNRSYEETQTTFDKLVLEVYRDLSAKLTTPPLPPKEEVYENIGGQINQKKEFYTPGNLPIEGDRRSLIDF